MTDGLDHQIRMALRRRRRSRPLPIAIIVFAICATACAYLWVKYGAQIQTAVLASPQANDPTTTGVEQSVSRADFDTFKRQTTDSLRSATENLEAQKADLKTLSDKVTDLVSKVDALQNSAAISPAPPPIAQTVIAPRPAPIAQRKKPQAPKSTGRVSVGGAPLPIAPPSNR